MNVIGREEIYAIQNPYELEAILNGMGSMETYSNMNAWNKGLLRDGFEHLAFLLNYVPKNATPKQFNDAVNKAKIWAQEQRKNKLYRLNVSHGDYVNADYFLSEKAGLKRKSRRHRKRKTRKRKTRKRKTRKHKRKSHRRRYR